MRRSKVCRSISFPFRFIGNAPLLSRFPAKWFAVFAFFIGATLISTEFRPAFSQNSQAKEGNNKNLFSAFKDFKDRIVSENSSRINQNRPGEQPKPEANRPNYSRSAPPQPQQARSQQTGPQHSTRTPAQNGSAQRQPSPQQSPPPQTPPQPTTVLTVDQLTKASTTRQSAHEAINQIPWNSLSPSDRETIESLIAHHSLYRRLPLSGGYCNPEVYDFLVCHPEMVIGLWRTLGFSQVALSEIRPGQYLLRESSGTSADIRVLYHDNQKILFYCAGIYQGQMAARPIQGEAFVIMQYRFTEDKNKGNAPIVITRLDSFMRLSNAGADLVSKAFAPMIGKIVDSNFLKTVDFVNNVSETMETNPGALVVAVQSIPDIPPATKNEFLTFFDRVSSQAFLRSQGELVDYYLLPKPNAPQVGIAPLLSRRNGITPTPIPETQPTLSITPHSENSLSKTATLRSAPPTLGTTIPMTGLSIDSLPVTNRTEKSAAVRKPTQTSNPPSFSEGSSVSVIPLTPISTPAGSPEKDPLIPGTLLTQNKMEDFSLNDDMTFPKPFDSETASSIGGQDRQTSGGKKDLSPELRTLQKKIASHEKKDSNDKKEKENPNSDLTVKQEKGPEPAPIASGWNPKEEKGTPQITAIQTTPQTTAPQAITVQATETTTVRQAESGTVTENSKSLWKKPTFMNPPAINPPAPLTDATDQSTAAPSSKGKLSVKRDVRNGLPTEQTAMIVPSKPNSSHNQTDQAADNADDVTLVFPTDPL